MYTLSIIAQFKVDGRDCDCLQLSVCAMRRNIRNMQCTSIYRYSRGAPPTPQRSDAWRFSMLSGTPECAYSRSRYVMLYMRRSRVLVWTMSVLIGDVQC